MKKNSVLSHVIACCFHVTNMLLHLQMTFEQNFGFKEYLLHNGNYKVYLYIICCCMAFFCTGRARLIRSHLSSRISFELSGNTN